MRGLLDRHTRKRRKTRHFDQKGLNKSTSWWSNLTNLQNNLSFIFNNCIIQIIGRKQLKMLFVSLAEHQWKYGNISSFLRESLNKWFAISFHEEGEQHPSTSLLHYRIATPLTNTAVCSICRLQRKGKSLLHADAVCRHIFSGKTKKIHKMTEPKHDDINNGCPLTILCCWNFLG